MKIRSLADQAILFATSFMLFNTCVYSHTPSVPSPFVEIKDKNTEWKSREEFREIVLKGAEASSALMAISFVWGCAEEANPFSNPALAALIEENKSEAFEKIDEALKELQKTGIPKRQTSKFKSLVKHTIETSIKLIEAINREQPHANLLEEYLSNSKLLGKLIETATGVKDTKKFFENMAEYNFDLIQAFSDKLSSVKWGAIPGDCFTQRLAIVKIQKKINAQTRKFIEDFQKN